jgi:hypothetical protein
LGIKMATGYRCFLMDGGALAGVVMFDREDDAAAQVEALRVLEMSDYQCIEVWQDHRKVAVIRRNSAVA